MTREQAQMEATDYVCRFLFSFFFFLYHSLLFFRVGGTPTNYPTILSILSTF